MFPERIFQRELTEGVGHVPNVLGRYHPMNTPTLNKKEKKRRKLVHVGCPSVHVLLLLVDE